MATTSATVLVVDDEPGIADLYTTWLREDYNVRTAYGGDEALELLDEEVNFVLLDRRMPTMSGDEVLKQIRNRKLDCRVAMLTAVEPDYDILEMGFDDYAVKPISRSDLGSLLEGLGTMSSYNEVSRQLYQLASKRAALEANKSQTELTNHPEYEQLLHEFEDLKQQADQQATNLGDGAFSVL